MHIYINIYIIYLKNTINTIAQTFTRLPGREPVRDRQQSPAPLTTTEPLNTEPLLSRLVSSPLPW